MTPADRSAIMASIKSSNTGPERAARMIARLSGVKFRVNARDLPGSPDLAFDEDKVAVFVHGCFWHRHGCRRGSKIPKASRRFWLDKFAKNVKRDRAAQARLELLGWHVVVVWECEL